MVHLSPTESYLFIIPTYQGISNSDRIPLPAPCGPNQLAFQPGSEKATVIDGMTTEGTSNRHSKSGVLFIFRAVWRGWD